MERILNHISNFIQTEEGKKYLFSLKETDNVEEIKERYEEFQKYESLLKKKEFIFPHYKKYEKEISLNKYFVWFKNYLEEVINLKKEIDELDFDSDDFVFLSIDVFDFFQRLNLTFDDEGRIKDSASPRLKEIREKKQGVYREIEKKIKSAIKKFREIGILRDDEIYYKEGRFTVCLKTLPENVILVSYSRSGESYFVEPEDVINLNSKFRHLDELEKEEERRIINEIYKIYMSLQEDIEEIISDISKLDYYNAVFKFSNEINGTIPKYGKDKKFYLKDTYHPYLKIKLKEKCVPYNISFGGENKILLVTGPNGGGKTSFLESIYLLIKMIKRSIPVPASSESYFYIPSVILRAGFEERSNIEEGLSSFTLYLEEIKKALNIKENEKLVLLDEFMGNTDPEEGGNLGIAILREFRDRNIFTLCATHNDKIKSFLKDEKGILVSAFEMDFESMTPTFRLEAKKVSPSFAVIVAKRSGLPSSIFEKMPESSKIIKRLYDLKKEVEEERRKIEMMRRELEREKEYIENEFKRKLKEKLEKIEKDFLNLLSEIKKEKSKKKIEDFRKKLVEIKTKEIHEDKIPEKIEIGRFYSVLKSGVKGKLIEVREKKAVLDVKGKKMEIPVSFLREISEKDKEKEIELKSYTFPLPSRVLSIRGMKKEDAEEVVIRFIYDARAAGYNEVRIVHGEGKGILKKMVFDVIKNIDFVDEFYHPPWNEGGDGVTVVKFKKL